MTTDINLPRISIKQLRNLIANTPASHNIMLVGDHGIGKSEILKQCFEHPEESGLGGKIQPMKVVALFLGQMADPGDIIGLPRPVRVQASDGTMQEKMDYARPQWFPTDGNPIVLFLDELNRARPEILQTVMDLTLNRTLMGKELPKGSRIISAVNWGEDYDTNRLDRALVSRFNIYKFAPTADEWLEWAEAKGLDDRVLLFFSASENKDYLDGIPNTKRDPDELEKTPDRRAWERVSDVIQGKATLSDDLIMAITGIVGQVAASKFITSCKDGIISAKDLLLNYEKVKANVEKYDSIKQAVLVKSIFRMLNSGDYQEDEAPEMAKNLVSYVRFLQMRKSENFAGFYTEYQNAHERYPVASNFLKNVSACKPIREMINHHLERMGKNR